MEISLVELYFAPTHMISGLDKSSVKIWILVLYSSNLTAEGLF